MLHLLSTYNLTEKHCCQDRTSLLACMQLICATLCRGGEWSAEQPTELFSEPFICSRISLLEPTRLPCPHVLLCWSGGCGCCDLQQFCLLFLSEWAMAMRQANFAAFLVVNAFHCFLCLWCVNSVQTYICNPHTELGKLTESKQCMRRTFWAGRKCILVTSFRPVSLTGTDSSILYSCVSTCTAKLM